MADIIPAIIAIATIVSGFASAIYIARVFGFFR